MKQKLPRLYGITVWDLRPLLSCCWGYSLGLFFFKKKHVACGCASFCFFFEGSCEPKKVDSWNAKTPPVINQILIFTIFCASKNLPKTHVIFLASTQASQGFVVQPYELRYLHYRKAGLLLGIPHFNGNYYDKQWVAKRSAASNHLAGWMKVFQGDIPMPAWWKTHCIVSIWVNYNDLTATSLESWLVREIFPKWP